jgi:hypothetical protein
MVVSLPAWDGGNAAGGHLIAPSMPVARRTTLRYAVFVTDDFTQRIVHGTPLEYVYDGGRSVTIFLYLNASTNVARFDLKVTAPDKEDSFGALVTTPLVKGRWTDVLVDVEHDVVPTRATFAYDGKVIFAGKALFSDIPPAAPRLSFGVSHVNGGPSLLVYFDDVRLDLVQ